MAEVSTYIKLDRNITDWRWYQNANTFRVFIHCLISANIKDHPFEKIIIRRGEFATSYEKIATSLGLSVGQIRTAIEHLKSTGELTVKKYSKFQVISIRNYNKYQGKSTGRLAFSLHSDCIQIADSSQQSKNDKNEKNEKNVYIGTKRKKKDGTKGASFDTDEFYEAAVAASNTEKGKENEHF